MKTALLSISIILVMSFVSCENLAPKKSALQLKEELKSQEHDSPSVYLSLENVLMQNNKIKNAGLFTNAKYDGYLLEGQITNTATLAKYKDIQINVLLNSKTGTTLSDKTYTIYEYILPNSSKDFSIKVDAPDETASYNASIINAKPSY